MYEVPPEHEATSDPREVAGCYRLIVVNVVLILIVLLSYLLR